MMTNRRQIHVLSLVWPVLLLLLASCGAQPADLATLFPEAPAGWQATGEPQVYGSDTIFDLVNGQADAFFAYGFEQVAVQSYENGEGTTLRITIWQLATPEDAYGLFTANAFGTPVALGNGGAVEPGQRSVFWQDRYFVDLFALPSLDNAQALLAFGEATSAQLPSGGEPPALMARLPAGGLVTGSPLFFHEEISIQDRLWLGGENILGLGPETGGVLARYDVGGVQAQLLLVQYPSAGEASAGLAALQSSPPDSLVAADVKGDLLGAVLGAIDEGTADSLLSQALR